MFGSEKKAGMGCVFVPFDPEEKANTLTFTTFTLADEMQREGVLVAFDKV